MATAPKKKTVAKKAAATKTPAASPVGAIKWPQGKAPNKRDRASALKVVEKDEKTYGTMASIGEFLMNEKNWDDESVLEALEEFEFNTDLKKVKALRRRLGREGRLDKAAA